MHTEPRPRIRPTDRPADAATYRDELPQLGGRLFLADGGIETTLIYHEGLELPHFAAFVLLGRPAGRDALRRYYRTYAALAAREGVGLVLESATWRASADWGARLGYAAADLDRANREAVALLEEVRADFESAATPIVVSGCVGPRGDGYDPSFRMSVGTAERYHAVQIASFAGTAADLVTAMTINYAEEGVGIARAATAHGMPVAISFTVETDGRLPTGQTLRDAIAQVDDAGGEAPAYYMVNCAHPLHFDGVLAGDEAWLARIRGLRANASDLSHAELDAATRLHDGDPADLARHYAALRTRLPELTVLGGCCGTDQRHIERIARTCAPLFRSEADRHPSPEEPFAVSGRA
jgi:S-methylmethionine-dependent homocysteine/selenocysteine methylase